ncbi:LacI family DNA-binding transcriptional regulator [candidate division KSB1 bacterium]|nr:LacI family DNA-binding transcriptional regulator [candidate division KSB1 bacterium]
MVTIKDLAQQLNLHHTTVSKALRDHPDIKKETRDRIKALAIELDYHPNVLAQSFKRRTSNTIGIIVPNINVDFFSTVISAIEDVVYDAGYTIMISQSNENFHREVLNAKTMLSNQVAGLIISVSRETQTAPHLTNLKNNGIPVVCFDRVIADVSLAKVVVDDYQAAFQLTEYLIQKDYTTIAHLGGPNMVSVSVDRYQGFIDAQKKHALPVHEQWIKRGGFREADGFENMNATLSQPPLPRAVFAVNDQVAFGAYGAIKKLGLSIPDDIAVAGFGNLMLAQYMDPALTTVAQEPAEMGRSCAKLMLEAIQNPVKQTRGKTVTIPTRLIIRAST